MRAKSSLLIAALLIQAASGSADLITLNGDETSDHFAWTRYYFDVTQCGTLKFRVPMPDGSLECSWNTFVCWEPRIRVWADEVELTPDVDFWWMTYNEGYVNRGAWIYVPNPGRSYDQVDVELEDRQRISTNAGLLTYEIPWYTYDVTNYCRPTGWIDAGSPIVLSCLQEALGTYGGNPNLAPSAWGDVEAISLWMRNEMLAQENDWAERTASEVLASLEGDCMDLTVAFCALCRRRGIPARPCGGMALAIPNACGYEFPEDNLHIFAEYWDGTRGTWVALDPFFGTEFASVSIVWHAAAEDLDGGIIPRVWPDCGAVMYADIPCDSQQLGRTGSLWPRDPRPAPGGDLVALELSTLPFEPPGMMPPSDGSGYGSVAEEVCARGFDGSLALTSSPNPFSSCTHFSFEIPRFELVTLRIYDVRGRLVRMLFEEQCEGSRDVEWDGRDDHGELLAPGVYLVRFQSGGISATRKVLLLR